VQDLAQHRLVHGHVEDVHLAVHVQVVARVIGSPEHRLKAEGVEDGAPRVWRVAVEQPADVRRPGILGSVIWDPVIAVVPWTRAYDLIVPRLWKRAQRTPVRASARGASYSTALVSPRACE
jgi:hypothetical protein